MDWTARIRRAFDGLPRTPDEDVVEELAQHARATYDAARAEGCSQDEAVLLVDAHIDRWRREAGVLQRRSRRPAAVEPPAHSGASAVGGMVQDFRYALRLLRREPRHAVLTVVTMALAIGATTALFSVTYGVLLKRLPYPNADRMVVLNETRGGNAPRFGEFTNAAYLAWRDTPGTLDNIAVWSRRVATVTGAGEPERLRITAATASLFPVLGVRPLIGAFFTQQDESSPVIVLSEALWRTRFAADPAALGRPVHLDGQPYTVIGVLPGGVMFPDDQSRAIVPQSVPQTTGNSLSLFNAVALLAPGATPAQAAAEGTARGRSAADTGLTTMAIFGSNGPVEIAARPLHEALTADVRQPLLMLLAAVALLLAAATANVASLQLARATTRRREIAIRAALGASGARVTRQLLVEGLVLGLFGGAAGLALSALLNRSMPSVLPAGFPRAQDIAIDAMVAGFALALSTAASVVFGLAAAWRVRRLKVGEALADDGAASVGVSPGSAIARARAPIMAGQVAIACVLLVGAALVGRSFFAMLSADRGFDPAGVLSMGLSMPGPMFPAAERRFAIVDDVLGRIARVPGVRDAALASELPLTPGGSTSAFTMKAPHADGGVVRVQASPRIVSARYFSALGTRITAGRPLLESDTEASEPVVVVNDAFARRYLGSSPIGAKVPMAGYGPPQGEPPQCTVVGIVENVRYISAAETSRPEMYFSYRQMAGRLPVQTVTLLARTSGTREALAVAMRAAIRAADERLVTDAVLPLEERLLTTLARPRLYAVLLAAFAGFSLITATVGLFGVLSYSVSQRAREFAVRTALGARRSDILLLVLGKGLAITVAGAVAGLVASAWLTKLLSAQLYGVTPHDPLTFVLVPVLLLIVGLLACARPAWRAATLDPLRVLRGN